MDYPQTNATVLAAIAMWISDGGTIRSQTLMRFWMPGYSWQLGLGPLRFKVQLQRQKVLVKSQG